MAMTTEELMKRASMRLRPRPTARHTVCVVPGYAEGWVSGQWRRTLRHLDTTCDRCGRSLRWSKGIGLCDECCEEAGILC